MVEITKESCNYSKNLPLLTNCLLFGTNIMTKVMRQMPIRPKPKQTGAKDSFNTVADNTQANHDGIVTAIKTPMYLDSLE